MATGLAWTPLGGAVLTIEAVANEGKEGFKLTGKLGEVMQESASIAYSYVRHISTRPGREPGFLGEKPHPPARARRGHAEGRAIGRHHPCLRPAVPGDGKEKPESPWR